MKSEESNNKREYLKYAIQYLENRISMIDNRSSILIAAHGILFAVYAEFVKFGFIGDSLPLVSNNLSILCIFIAFLMLIASVFMLLKTIRPTLFPLDFNVKPERLEGVKFEFLWPGKGWGKVKFKYLWLCRDILDCNKKVNIKDYNKAFNDLDDNQIMEGLKNTNFILLGHVERKMIYYKIAVFFIKILLVFYFISILVLSLITNLILPLFF